MKKLGKSLGIVFTAFGISACASIVSEKDSTTYIETDPEKARCELHGQDFKRVIETPNSITLPAKAAPLTIACRADGYRTTTEKLDTELDGWIFGNILFGGIIGIAVDAARGAGQKFPPRISVLLEPEKFADNGRRDEFYDKVRTSAEGKWAKIIKDIQSRCSSGQEASVSECLERTKKLEAQRDKELAEIEIRRTSATVGAAIRDAVEPDKASKSQAPSGEAGKSTPAGAPNVVRADAQDNLSGELGERLRKLRRMQEEGLISPSDYESQKKKLLDRM